MTEHTVTIASLPPDRYQARCSCRWRMAPTINLATAEAQAEQHRSYVAEVRALTREVKA